GWFETSAMVEISKRRKLRRLRITNPVGKQPSARCFFKRGRLNYFADKLKYSQITIFIFPNLAYVFRDSMF
ncbi:MAG: hypothetical protein U9P79_09710, partial [Candidatus Cloacimonadota bacterium]|nr:hypothetical protein [Candidatus Cloacimonadota bacterium]